MRIGDYRVLYFVLEKKVRVTEILHRSQAYRGLDGVRQAVDRSTGRGLGRVRYLLVGGYASVVHGVPRTTLDVDLALLGRALGTICIVVCETMERSGSHAEPINSRYDNHNP